MTPAFLWDIIERAVEQYTLLMRIAFLLVDSRIGYIRNTLALAFESAADENIAMVLAGIANPHEGASGNQRTVVEERWSAS